MIPTPSRLGRHVRHTLTSLLVGTTLLLASCGADVPDAVASDQPVSEETAAASRSIAGELREAGLTSFADVVEQAGIVLADSAEDLTIIAPANEAFLLVDADLLADILADPARVESMVADHTMPGDLSAADLAALDQITSGAGRDIPVSAAADALKIGQGTIVEADIPVTFGSLHIIDRVLLP